MPPRRRAPPVAAPGAPRVALAGVVAASDDFGRVRLLFPREGPDGKRSQSWFDLRGAVPAGGAGFRPPYRAHARADGQPDDDTWGEAWFAVPARHREHWLATAASLRNRWARAEATVRRYAFTDEGGVRREGASLDLAALDALASEAPAAPEAPPQWSAEAPPAATPEAPAPGRI